MILTLGSTNPFKIAEYRAMSPPHVELVPYGETDPEETGSSLRENAFIKAVAYATVTGRKTVSEDSGMFVDALGGLPGVHSARFDDCILDPEAARVLRHVPSGRNRAEIDAANTQRVLKLLYGLPLSRRTASYRLAMVVVDPDGTILFETETRFDGMIALEPRGRSGFGYDPIFVGWGCDGKTCAEIDPEFKNRISHRGAFPVAPEPEGLTGPLCGARIAFGPSP